MNTRTFRLQAANMRPLFENLFKNIVPQMLSGCADLEIVLRPYKSKRSTEQNKRLWALYRDISENVWVNGRRFDSETWHEHFKRELIGIEEIVLPSGEIERRGISTTTLNTAQMAEYQTRIEAWAAQQGVVFEYGG